MPWSDSDEFSSFHVHRHMGFAARWMFDQETATALLATLGPSRCLLLRYEDVVADPQASRHDIASFLGLDATAPAQAAPAGIVLPWEPWKQSALDEVKSDRLAAWGDNLPTLEATQVAAICRKGMRQFSYSEGCPGAVRAAFISARMGPGVSRQLRRYLEGYREYSRYITSIAL